ncbi:ABC transporter ATP-binding protein [Phytohabitans kaempferiae]|uniref:ABC transporter ATP-binding protein n=1 Tax=Phytohabitans kaempferiae TaxID=1620943 RepID=A0ABV6MFB6_9ACTN
MLRRDASRRPGGIAMMASGARGLTSGARQQAAVQEDIEYLVLEGLRKNYRSVTAVDGVSMSVRRGEILVLLGPSGCGKTTTLNMIAGFVRPDAGRVRLNGRDITDLPVQRRQVGMVFQRHALFPHMSAYENVAYGLRRRRVPRDELHTRVRQKLDMVGLGDHAQRLPGELSGGQQQRVALARALVIRPDVLLLDEPLSALDAKLRVGMREEIRALVDAEQVTAVLVTHDQEEALAVADAIAVMDGGLVRQLAPPRELYSNPTDRFVATFIGDTVAIPGVVVEAGAGTATLRVGDSMLSGADPAGELTPGAPAEALVRPERITILEDGEPGRAEGNSWLGRLESQVFLGSAAKLTFAGSCRLAFPSGSARPLRVGTEYTLTWSRADTRIFRTGGTPSGNGAADG